MNRSCDDMASQWMAADQAQILRLMDQVAKLQHELFEIRLKQVDEMIARAKAFAEQAGTEVGP